MSSSNDKQRHFIYRDKRSYGHAQITIGISEIFLLVTGLLYSLKEKTMHIVGNYIFDPDRLILYVKDLAMNVTCYEIEYTCSAKAYKFLTNEVLV